MRAMSTDSESSDSMLWRGERSSGPRWGPRAVSRSESSASREARLSTSLSQPVLRLAAAPGGAAAGGGSLRRAAGAKLPTSARGGAGRGSGSRLPAATTATSSRCGRRG
jgi:hypothetical protein